MTLNRTYGGALNKDCPWYVQRPEDDVVFSHLVRGDNCYVLTSHQMGKSSLIVRLAEKLRQAGLATVVVDLAAFGCELTAAQWYYALSQRIGRQLHLEDTFDHFWSIHRDGPPSETFAQALEQIAFRVGSERLVIFIDEVDLLGSLPFSPDEFLRMVHGAAWASAASQVQSQHVTYCLLGTTAPAALWRNPGQVANRLGQVVLLRDFDRANLEVLASRLACELRQIPTIEWPDQLYTPEFLLERILDRVFYWTNGHPYLTQILTSAATHQVLEQLASGVELLGGQCRDVVDHYCHLLFTGPTASTQDAHLLWIRHCLLRSPPDAAQIFDSHRFDWGELPSDVAREIEAQRWHTSGIVRFQNGHVEWRNRIYERVFATRRLPANRERLPAWWRSATPAEEPEMSSSAECAMSLVAPTLSCAG